MNETRKQIIELIWEYMDKTLKFGCIVQNTSKEREYLILFEWDYWYVIEEKNSSMFDCRYFWRIWSPILHNCSIESNKIIWHYDITAVLKYIYDYTAYTSYEIKKEELLILCSRNIDINYWKIPNKPLSLYTKQEEKELLELLNKLKDD